jgi:hypothetical protein
MFDASQFLDMPINEANDTTLTPVPVGEYMATIEKVDCRQWTKKDDPSVGGIALDIIWNIDDQEVLQTLGREKVTCKQGIMLDLTPAGGLDFSKGRNIGLGRLREAVNLNVPGQPFSFNMLPGRMAKVSVKHRVVEDMIYAEVKAVAKL